MTRRWSNRTAHQVIAEMQGLNEIRDARIRGSAAARDIGASRLDLAHGSA